MKKSLLAIASVGLASVAACATYDSGTSAAAAGASPLPETDCRAAQLRDYGHQAVCLGDIELDSIVAGRVTIVETGFNTWIVNPGRAGVGILHKDGSFTCINLCGVPPPPPPPGGGGGGN